MQRFAQDRAARDKVDLNDMPIDPRFLAALEAGLPDCAGVALGLDRLLAIKLGHGCLAEGLAFQFESA